jgi:hypothetical protein
MTDQQIAKTTLTDGPVTLWREIDALGGAAQGERDEGYNEALRLVLTILGKRGFTEFADPVPVDRIAELQACVEIQDTDRSAAQFFTRWLSGANTLGNLRRAFARHRTDAFIAGAQACREYMARFVEQGGDKATAASIRANWNPSWGNDLGKVATPS